MKLSLKVTNSGISISAGEDVDKPPQKSKDAHQDKPRKNYVYAHLDSFGKIFYIGKGTGRRAWSRDRHSLWTRYVEKHLGGQYVVEILNDNLCQREAEELESEWISHHQASLVNWINVGRRFDYKALDEFNQKRNANKKLIEDAYHLEKSDLEYAVKLYIQAIASIPSYLTIKYETGLVADLMEEENQEIGLFGEARAIERLVMCLIKLDRIKEAETRFDEYFRTYRGDQRLAAYERTVKRLSKVRKSP